MNLKNSLNMSLLRVALCVVALLCVQNAYSATGEYREVEEKLNKTFTNFTATFVKPSPIAGLFEIHTTDNIIYFDPISETLIFGRVFDKNGVDLTRDSLTQATKSRMRDAGGNIEDKLDSAVVVGEGGDIALTIFTNPDCPYCIKADQWLDDIAQAKGIAIEKRLIFLSSSRFEHAASKIEHVICAKNKTHAYKAINTTPRSERATCSSAQATLKTHSELVEFFGVNGTPSFLLDDGEIISGLNMTRLSEVIDTLVTLNKNNTNGEITQ